MAIIKGVPYEDTRHISKIEARTAATDALITCVKVSERLRARLALGKDLGAAQDLELFHEVQQLVDVELFHNIEKLQNYILQANKKGKR